MEDDLPFSETDENYFNLLSLFLKGDDVQKMSVVHALPQLLLIDSQATSNRIIPKIQQELNSASCEFHVMTSAIFGELIQKQTQLNLLGTVLQGIDSRDPIAANAWMDVLIRCIPSLPESYLKGQVLPVAVQKSNINQSLTSRIYSCKILGKIASYPKLKQIDIQKDIVPLVLSLCQDCSFEVRATMCSQLPSVTEGVGKDFVKTNLLPSLVELASDNNAQVRGASASTVVFMIPYLDADTKKNIMIPLVTQLCDKSMQKEDVTAGIVAGELGKIMKGLQSSMTKLDRNWFLKCYKTLSQRGLSNNPGDVFSVDATKEVMCRDCCANNLPFMADFTKTAIPEQMDLFYSVFRDLAVDPCYIVRRTVAGTLHEIVKILETQSRTLRPDIVRLLRDDAEEVLQTLVPHLGDTLLCLARYGVLDKATTTPCTQDLGRALFKCHMELTKGYNWRLLTLFLVQLEQLVFCAPGDFIHQHFTPVVLGNAINGRAKPVRSQAVRTLLIFLRYNTKEVHQKWLRDTLIKQLCYSDSCYTRSIFVKMCDHASEIFHDKYFQEHFLTPLLQLADDPVSNIRYSLVEILPTVKLILSAPGTDSRHLSSFSATLHRLQQTEKDKDVLARLKARATELTAVIPAAKVREREQRQQRELAAMAVVSGGAVGGAASTGSRTLKRVFSQVASQTAIQPTQLKTTTTPSAPSKSSLSSASNKSYSSTISSRTLQSSSSVNDMSILKQHFYIDAGISLPFTGVSTPSNSSQFSSDHTTEILNYSPAKSHSEISLHTLNITPTKYFSNYNYQPRKTYTFPREKQKTYTKIPSFTETLLHDNNLNLNPTVLSNVTQLSTTPTIISTTTNITDDLKVNLRRISRISTPAKFSGSTNTENSTKRFSMSFIPEASLKNCNNKTLNRRSLNISSVNVATSSSRGELSRIPVCSGGGGGGSTSSNLKFGYQTPKSFRAKDDVDLLVEKSTTALSFLGINSSRDDNKERSYSPRSSTKRTSGLPVSIVRRAT